mmetsp:Transcript_34500/g.63774  ORF Transcript_34500/g.63774 Transcript_34500/m.63774 type:complete len:89 (+) Transcript_34500:1106-1372(+)
MDVALSFELLADFSQDLGTAEGVGDGGGADRCCCRGAQQGCALFGADLDHASAAGSATEALFVRNIEMKLVRGCRASTPSEAPTPGPH